MLKIKAVLVLLFALGATCSVSADPNFGVWACAHARMVAKWRHGEPRCGWTVGGYTCAGRIAMRAPRMLTK